MSRPLLEIAAASIASALAAQSGGADRIELCENLVEGGTTPSYGTIAISRERLQIPIYVLIRPRGGDFLYDGAELEVMCRDIEACVRLGCNGVVIGALDADAAVDTTVCRELIAAAGSLAITFHRAFDAAANPAAALEAVIGLGCDRVLTSGGCDSASDGAEAIARFGQQAAGRISLMAGAGVNLQNIHDVVERSGAREVHASARSLHLSAMRHRNELLRGLGPDRLQSDEVLVRELVSALEPLG